MTDDLEKRIAALEAWHARVEPHINRSIPLGPRPLTDEEVKQRAQKFTDEMMKVVKKDIPPVDRNNKTLVSGAPVPEDQSHTELKANGQQKDYIVLTAEERAKGFIRPVRNSYKHVGAPPPEYPLRDLTADEQEKWGHGNFVKYETYPRDDSHRLGKFWTQAQLDAVGQGCGTVTTMGNALSETYARDPKFYGGTFCCGCGKHHPVNEFVWQGTAERVGS